MTWQNNKRHVKMKPPRNLGLPLKTSVRNELQDLAEFHRLGCKPAAFCLWKIKRTTFKADRLKWRVVNETLSSSSSLPACWKLSAIDGILYFSLTLNCFYTIVLRTHLENFESLWWYNSVLESLQSTKALCPTRLPKCCKGGFATCSFLNSLSCFKHDREEENP